ncbi:uncharacterized protein PHALS_07090 [Plasmopara halstedii]|uniref:Uncharacterized protein n=1 Tax=Plasmopara halstedii TaxID=4781 RepID=A0A0P1B6E6_PLAHL|nr:uncharacterized protein PHALS_07090 [Plasmopara halstedii]CEG49320.1 hypothetical protein PHALS_07090 [Plasmopara halstedii]|eukprot:XP_024585689.1 hypothetical protein PHALS_07090 [Plasmopara halstedii]
MAAMATLQTLVEVPRADHSNCRRVVLVRNLLALAQHAGVPFPPRLLDSRKFISSFYTAGPLRAEQTGSRTSGQRRRTFTMSKHSWRWNHWKHDDDTPAA